MINPSGNVTVNGITDTELAEILEIKAKNQNAIGFNPQQLQSASQAGQSFYNNAVFSWSGDRGLEIVQEVIVMLLKKEGKAKAQGQ